jgi:hypothetical protein
MITSLTRCGVRKTNDKDLYLTQTSEHEQRLWAIIPKLTMAHGEHVMGG